MSGEKNAAEEEDELFYFESDHLALKGNADYSELLKVMFVLESQRKRAIEDYSKIVTLQKEFENDPMEMIRKLENKESLGVPDLQVIAEVPKINWDKFDIKVPENLLAEVNNAEDQPTKRVVTTDNLNKDKLLNTKSKPWTVEEQKRLEELLVTYPPEDIELRRYKKIAAALGSRTVKQVCSRIQKYFLKLKKAGLPIPGRIPKVILRKKNQQMNCITKPSTFFPELNIPVTMNECEDIPGASQSSYPVSEAVSGTSSNYLLNTGYLHDKDTLHTKDEAEIQLNILQLIRCEKLREAEENACLFQHIGYKCDYCEEEPISGSRWHCTTCRTTSVDFCTDCMLSQMYSTVKHPLFHKFLIVRDDENNVTVEDEKFKLKEPSDEEKDSNLSSDIDSEELEALIESESAKRRLNGSFRAEEEHFLDS